ncbi:MAG: hypothetical protein M3Q29_14415 [Chloroflexota bacterium]|nr:hypothetical protein [Chloroflexota bacterium]
MSNVNSEDTGGAPAEAGGATGGGGTRVVQQREEVTGRGGWRIVGTLVGTVFLLLAPIWIVAEILRVTAVVGDSGIRWLYASVLVIAVFGGLWFLFQILRRSTGSAD